MLAQAANDKRDFLLRNFRVLAIRPEALGIKLLERLARQLKTAFVFRGIPIVHGGNLTPFHPRQQAQRRACSHQLPGLVAQKLAKTDCPAYSHRVTKPES